MFYLTHAPRWAEQAEALGLDPEELALLQTRIDTAREAFNTQRQALSAARSSTQLLTNALDAMNTLGSSVIQQIRARSATMGDTAYSLGRIRRPDKPSPIAPPGKPCRFTADLGQADGSLTLRWACTNPRGSRGTAYNVHRRIDGGNGQWEFLGIAGRKQYIDGTLPPGIAGVTYRVQAFRSTALGPVAEHSVCFGAQQGLPMPGPMQLAVRRRRMAA